MVLPENRLVHGPCTDISCVPARRVGRTLGKTPLDVTYVDRGSSATKNGTRGVERRTERGRVLSKRPYRRLRGPRGGWGWGCRIVGTASTSSPTQQFLQLFQTGSGTPYRCRSSGDHPARTRVTTPVPVPGGCGFGSPSCLGSPLNRLF